MFEKHFSSKLFLTVLKGSRNSGAFQHYSRIEKSRNSGAISGGYGWITYLIGNLTFKGLYSVVWQYRYVILMVGMDTWEPWVKLGLN